MLVPYCMGAVAGAIASGHVPAGGKAGDPWSSWINPTSILGGVLAVTVCAYLAAVYLIWDAQRFAGTDMIEYFRRRAVGAAVVAGVVAFVGFFVLHDYAHYVFDGLTSRALPLVIISAVVRARLARAPGARGTSWRTRARGGRGRDASWDRVGRRAMALHPAHDASRCPQAAAPDPTLTTILVVFVVAAAVILPSLGFLYVLGPEEHARRRRPTTVTETE